MLYNLSLTAARRVIVPSLVSRSLLARSISSTPLVFSPTKAEAVTKSKAKPKTTKSEAKKPKKEEEKAKKPTFTREQLKIPPRPVASGYLMFSNSERRKLPKPVTLAESQDQFRRISEKWQSLSAEEKKVYDAKAVEDNEEVARVYNDWMKNVDPLVLRHINEKRQAAGKPKIHRPRPREGPKRPMVAFFQFLRDFRSENPTLTAPECARQAGVAWRELPDEKKQKYTDVYTEAMKAYELERSAYNEAQRSV